MIARPRNRIRSEPPSSAQLASHAAVHPGPNSVLLQLLAGGVHGVIVGCLLARRVPPNRLKTAVALIAISASLQLVWSGSRLLLQRRAADDAMITARTGVAPGPLGSFL